MPELRRTTPVSAVQAQSSKPSVLVVDDEPSICAAMARVIRAGGFDVEIATDPSVAIEILLSRSFDVVVSDIMMPQMTGVDLLRVIRAYDLDIPVILMTGNPTLETAVDALDLGAQQYLPKPTPNAVVMQAVDRAARAHRMAVMKRRALDQAKVEAIHRAQLEVAFATALASLRMVFQPIVTGEDVRLYGYEALLRAEGMSPPQLLDAAERLGRVHDIGRRVRSLAAEAFVAHAPPGASLFVNLHATDLLDATLYEEHSPLGSIASRVVLEITERAAIDDIQELTARVAVLRYLGFRIAIDDLGAGYAGLASLASLEPEIVKLDMSLVRNSHESHVKRQLVSSIAHACGAMGTMVVAEGVETVEERDCVKGLGCGLLQGYLFGRPGPLS